MKIAILNLWSISENAIGGTERFVDDFAMSLKKLKHDVDVYMFSGNNFKKNGVNFISLDLFGKDVIADEYMIQEKFGDFANKSSYEKMSKMLEKRIDGSKYDLIHLNSHMFLKCFTSNKRILTMHSNYQELAILFSNKAYNLMIDLIKEEITNNDLKIVCPSIYYGKEWSKILNANVSTIYHAINYDRLVCTKDKNDLINYYSLSKNKIKILLPSRLEKYQKRPKLVLEALSKLNEKIRNKYQVVFTGIDDQYRPYVSELEEFSKQNKIDSKFITFNHISEAYKLCDVVCVPSKSESFGYSALESISLGIPTILSSIPTYLELKGDNSNVHIFKDINEFTNIFKDISNKNTIKRSIPKETWKEQFSLEDFGRKYIRLL